MRVGERIRAAIEARGLTLVDAAAVCGLPYRSLQDYVGLKREPGADALARICTHLRVSGTWLLIGAGEMDAAAQDQVADAPGDYGEGIAQRLAALGGLLADLSAQDREAILADALSRATQAQRLDALDRAVRAAAAASHRRHKRPPPAA